VRGGLDQFASSVVTFACALNTCMVNIHELGHTKLHKIPPAPLCIHHMCMLVFCTCVRACERACMRASVRACVRACTRACVRACVFVCWCVAVPCSV